MPASAEGRLLIDSYSSAGFRIGNQVYQGATLVCDDRAWPLTLETLESLTLDQLAPLQILPEPVSLLLLGTGLHQQFISAPLRAAARQQGLSIECMTSAAACRTYNVLASEGRRVATLLLPLHGD